MNLGDLTKRRLLLCFFAPYCPECGELQIQLVEWICYPARWKCRVCKYKWEQEAPICFK
jgi:transposase-like protein